MALLVKHFEQNENGRDFVVGDIHGCFNLLSEQLIEINFDISKDRLFSVGDLVDRGKYSGDAVGWLYKSWFHAVRGNHEQMAIDYVNGDYPCDWYASNGSSWLIALPKTEQQRFTVMFDELPIAMDVQTKNGLVGIIHAECPVDDWSKLDKQLSGERADEFKEVCLWDRSRAKHNVTTIISGVHKVIVGHTPTKEVSILGNVMYIDTGAVFGGKLTIVEI